MSWVISSVLLGGLGWISSGGRVVRSRCIALPLLVVGEEGVVVGGEVWDDRDDDIIKVGIRIGF